MRARNSSSSVGCVTLATAAFFDETAFAFEGVCVALDGTDEAATCDGICGAARCTMVDVTFCRLSLIDFFSKYSFCS